MTTQATTTPARAAKRLNVHHLKTSAGFYTSNGYRCFGARVRAGQLQMTPDFDTWMDVDLDVIQFRDHNGRPIFL